MGLNLDQYFDRDKLFSDVREGISEALKRHSVDPHSVLGVTSVLEALSSEFKIIQTKSPLGAVVGSKGQALYYASILARDVALLQSPHSQIVNPMMEAIAHVLSAKRSPTAEDKLLDESIDCIREFSLFRDHTPDYPSFEASFKSALGYLIQGSIVERRATDQKLEMSEAFRE
jgi:hypothetical protein